MTSTFLFPNDGMREVFDDFLHTLPCVQSD